MHLLRQFSPSMIVVVTPSNIDSLRYKTRCKFTTVLIVKSLFQAWIIKKYIWHLWTYFQKYWAMDTASLTNSIAQKQCSSYQSERKLSRIVTRRLKNIIMENLLLFTTIIGVVLGFIVGFAVREAEPSENARMWLGNV